MVYLPTFIIQLLPLVVLGVVAICFGKCRLKVWVFGHFGKLMAITTQMVIHDRTFQDAVIIYRLRNINSSTAFASDS